MASIEANGAIVMVPSEEIKFLETKRRKMRPPVNTWDWKNEI